MNVAAALKSQYHAALKALRLAIEACPDAMWNDPRDGFAAFGRVAYHALFFAHFYAQKDQHSFTPWPGHSDQAHFLGHTVKDKISPPTVSEPLPREEILDYWRLCDSSIDAWVDALDLSSSDSGFPWYPVSKLEHQLVNVRHIQHHAAALSTRLRREAGISVPWVGKG